MAKLGRPINWPEPKTLMAKRLQEILPKVGLGQLSQNYFNGAARKTISKFLSGDLEPPPSSIITIAKEFKKDLVWLLADDEKSPVDQTGEIEIGLTMQAFYSALANLAGLGQKIADPRYAEWVADATKALEALHRGAPVVAGEQRRTRRSDSRNKDIA